MGNCVGGKGKKDPTVLTEEEIKLLLENTKLNRAQINGLHQNFLKECPSGKLTKKDFVKLFKEVHPSENKKEKADKFCEYVFKVIDTQGLGYISFNDFVLCFSLTSYGDFKQKCEFAFRLYDLDKDNLISKKEMTQVLEALYDLSGITDRKKDKAPAKKVEEIMKKINIKTDEAAAAAAIAVDVAAPAEPAPEAPVAEAEPKKGDKKEKKPKAAKAPKEKKAAAPKAAKPRDFINKDQFIEACSNDESLKKLFVDSIFASGSEAVVAAAAATVDLAAPSAYININSPPLDAPAIEITTRSRIEISEPIVEVIEVSAPTEAAIQDAVAALSEAVAAAVPSVDVEVVAPAVELAAPAEPEPVVVAACCFVSPPVESLEVSAPALELCVEAPKLEVSSEVPAVEVAVEAPAVEVPAVAVEAPAVAAEVPAVVVEVTAPAAVAVVEEVAAPVSSDVPVVEVAEENKPIEVVTLTSEAPVSVTEIVETTTTSPDGITVTETTITTSSSSTAETSNVVEQIKSVIDSISNADINVVLKN